METTQTKRHCAPFGTLTPKLLEEISYNNSDRYELLEEDFIDDCNGDDDAENIIVFKDTETGTIYRASWENDGWNTFSKLHEDQLTVEVVKEVTVIAYKTVEVIQIGC